jgi:hypothetical protein
MLTTPNSRWWGQLCHLGEERPGLKSNEPTRALKQRRSSLRHFSFPEGDSGDWTSLAPKNDAAPHPTLRVTLSHKEREKARMRRSQNQPFRSSKTRNPERNVCFSHLGPTTTAPFSPSPSGRGWPAGTGESTNGNLLPKMSKAQNPLRGMKGFVFDSLLCSERLNSPAMPMRVASGLFIRSAA